MLICLVGEVESTIRMIISYFLALSIIFPASSFAESKTQPKKVDMERVSKVVNDLTLRLKKKETLSKIIKMQKGKLSNVQRQYLNNQVSK